MKKALSLFLACLMLLACVPVMASAANITWADVATDSSTYTIPAGDTVTVTGTRTITGALIVEEGANLVIAYGGTLIIAGSGKLVNNGHISVQRGGSLTLSATGDSEYTAALVNNESGVIDIAIDTFCALGLGSYGYNRGTINNIERMNVKGNLSHLVKIPADFSDSYRYTETWDRQDKTVNFDVDYFMYQAGSEDLDYLDPTKYFGDNKTEIWVENGNQIFILITPEEGVGDWVDTGRMKLVVNGQMLDSKARIDNDRGVFCITPTSAVAATVYSTQYKDIEKLFEVELPRTDGYYTITKDGDVDVATVEYGKTLSFRVVLAEKYDKSDYYVYVNTLYLEPDEYGYYDVTGPITVDGMSTAGGVQEDVEITVMGVAPNERVEMAEGIIGFIKEIFDVIKSIFEYFIDIFSGLGNIGA